MAWCSLSGVARQGRNRREGHGEEGSPFATYPPRRSPPFWVGLAVCVERFPCRLRGGFNVASESAPLREEIRDRQRRKDCVEDVSLAAARRLRLFNHRPVNRLDTLRNIHRRDLFPLHVQSVGVRT